MEINVKEWLKENVEHSLVEFSEGIIKTSRKMYGIRMGTLRAYAKQLVKEYDLEALDFIVDESYEEHLLQCLIIGYSKELIEIKEQLIYDYLCTCDNWADVDTLCSTMKLKNEEKEIFYTILQKWRNDLHEYVLRFTLVYALHYLDDEHIDDIICFSKTLPNVSYQAKMANSWLLATAYINYAEKVRELLPILDDETYRYTKGKIRDSYRISKEEKEKFVR